MSKTVQEKSTGLKFAEQQLLRHGWEKGKGLGRSENGISEAIKVQIKCGKGGMGHKEGEQFSFHWWDHVFNKASSSLVVETGQSGVMVKKSDDSSDGLISAKKPRKAQQAKSMLYGCFVKSATLLSGELQSGKSSDSDDSSCSEDEDQKLDLSSTTKLSDVDLLNACGGRTAHKGARHGLTMSAKLARLEQQEQEFMNKYGKKKHTAETSTSSTDCLDPAEHPDIKEKTKRKKSKRQEGPSENNIHKDKMTAQVIDSSNDIEDSKPKKRKDSNVVSVNDDIITHVEPKKKKKKNRKEKAPEDGLNGECSIDVNETFTHTSEEQDAQLPMNDSIQKKKKKKKKRSKVVAETADTDEISEDATDAHCKQPQEGSVECQQTSDNISKKKKKSAMENSTSVMTVTEDTSNDAQIIDTQTEGQENNRKRKKKRSKKEQEEVESVQFEESMPKKKKSKE